MTPSQRAALRMMFGGRCAYCGCELPEKGWHADHVEPVRRIVKYVRVEGGPFTHKAVFTGGYYSPENHREDNYFPACAKCNIEKADLSLEIFRQVIQQKVRVLRDNSAAFRHAERFKRIVVVNDPVVFWFERCQQESA